MASTSPPEPRLLSALTRLCPELEPAQWRLIEFLPGGYRNENFRVSHGAKHYALRLARRVEKPAVERELAVTAALEQIFSALGSKTATTPGLAVPKIVAADSARGLQLSRFRDEPLLAEQPQLTAQQLGTFLAVLHEALRELPEPLAEDALLTDSIGHDLTAAGASQAAQDCLLDCAGVLAASHRRQPCHLDLNPWNLLHRPPADWVVLDWETLGTSHPLFDLVCLTLGYLREHERLAVTESFVADSASAYTCAVADAREQSFSAAELAAAQRLFQLREYAWAAAQIALGNTRDEVRQQKSDYELLLLQQGIDVVAG